MFCRFLLSHFQIFLVPDGNLTIHLRNPNPKLFDFENVFVYAMDDEESGTSAAGRMCEHLEDQTNSSAGIHLLMAFACPMSCPGRISVNFNCVNVVPHASLMKCEMYAKLSRN